MSSVFVVVKSGAYRHDLCGFTAKTDEFKALAKRVSLLERDKYHDFSVVEVSDVGDPEQVIATWSPSTGQWT